MSEAGIREGGSNLYECEGRIYLVSVAALEVGNKGEAACKAVGAAKAKKEMAAYLNGSEISSYAEVVTREEAKDGPDGRKVEAESAFVEKISERVGGTIAGAAFLCGRYSDDGSAYYYAIYKTVE